MCHIDMPRLNKPCLPRGLCLLQSVTASGERSVQRPGCWRHGCRTAPQMHSRRVRRAARALRTRHAGPEDRRALADVIDASIKRLHQQTKPRATSRFPGHRATVWCGEDAAYSTNQAAAAGLENVRPPQCLEFQSALSDAERPTNRLPQPLTASAQRNASAPSPQPIARHGTPIAAFRQDGPASGP